MITNTSATLQVRQMVAAGENHRSERAATVMDGRKTP
jgi:hypothetical protein